MPTVIITHEVKDFAIWKNGFDAHETARAAGMVQIIGIYQDIEKPSMVTVIAQFPSLEAVKGFLGDPGMQATMKEAGVIGMPEVKILQKA
jgi:hypothetical protein